MADEPQLPEVPAVPEIPEIPDIPEAAEISEFVSTYVIPWSINIFFSIAIFIVGRWVVKIIANLVKKALTKAKMDVILVNFVTSIISTVLLLFVIIAALNQLGVNTTSLIALLGAAGLAIGLALQGSLQNFASGVMLIVFRPFKNGDFVEAAGTSGVVEKISIFTTVMRTPDNREIIIPNGSIYSGTITNYSARSTRRVDMVFGIGYGDDIKKTKEVLNALIEADDRILKDPEPQVAVGELGDSSVNFIVRPWVNSADYWPVKLDFTENVKLAFDENGISIPFPQMDVHLDKAE